MFDGKLFNTSNLNSDTVKWLAAVLLLSVVPFVLDVAGVWELIESDLDAKIRSTISLVSGFCGLKAYQHRVNLKTEL